MEMQREHGRVRRPELRLSATMLFAGVVVSLAAGLLHPEAASANDHPAAFTEYASSNIWVGVHLGQFAGMAVLIAGLLALFGVRSYQSAVLGIALMLFGTVIAATRSVHALIGYLMGLSGMAYVLQGWVIGAEGFSPANALPTLAGIVLILAWTIWLLVAGWRLKDVPNSSD